MLVPSYNISKVKFTKHKFSFVPQLLSKNVAFIWYQNLYNKFMFLPQQF